MLEELPEDDFTAVPRMIISYNQVKMDAERW